MNWDAASAIGEIMGATAVVISLVYLGVQIRSQTRQSRIAAMHDISSGFRDVIGPFQSEQMAKLFVRAINGVDSLEEYEVFQLIIGCPKVLRVWEEAYYMHRDGNLDTKNWDGMPPDA